MLMNKDVRYRLFEMMNKVAGMPVISRTINENALPPGFSDSDVETLDDFISGNSIQEDDRGAETQSADIENIISKRRSDAPRDREDPYIHNKTIEIVDKQGKVLDKERLASEITQRPLTLLNTNEKVGKTGILKISLPAYKGLYYDESTKEFKVVNTCPNAGDCKLYCFQQKGRSVMYDVAVLSKTRILNFLLNRWEEFRYKLIDEIEIAKSINNKKGITTIMRWHDSGDFISEKYLELAMEIARRTPEVTHYAYTKMVSYGKKANVPENFIFTYSIDAGAPETNLIDKTIDKHAEVVPRELFKDLIIGEKPLNSKKGIANIHRFISPEAKNELRKRMSVYFNLDVNSIISFNKMNKIPETNELKWNVIVLPSDADTAAHRKDVLGVYLLKH